MSGIRAMNLPTREQVQEAYAEVQKNLREHTTDLTQEGLAEKSETSKDYMSRLECASRCPNLFYFIRIAIALDVDPVLMLSMVMRRLGL
jgi:predicted transcriptional regulator